MNLNASIPTEARSPHSAWQWLAWTSEIDAHWIAWCARNNSLQIKLSLSWRKLEKTNKAINSHSEDRRRSLAFDKWMLHVILGHKVSVGYRIKYIKFYKRTLDNLIRTLAFYVMNTNSVWLPIPGIPYDIHTLDISLLPNLTSFSVIIIWMETLSNWRHHPSFAGVLELLSLTIIES